MTPPLRIALIVEPISWYGRKLIDGIVRYSREHGPWRFLLQENTFDGRVEPWLRRWKPDGVLARVTSRRMAKQLHSLGVPIVDLLAENAAAHIPQIVCDDQEVVRRAVDHLLERGLKHFAFVGRRDTQFAQQRRRMFVEYVTLRQREMARPPGMTKPACASMMLPWESMPQLHFELADWLRALPKPLGVVACNDVWASQVLRVCSEYDMNVPDHVAVIGVDDDPVFCQMSNPALTSIGCNSHVIGYRAAAMLRGMITRGESPPPITFVEPGIVRSRKSTDTIAISDQAVVAAVRYVRLHACEGLSASAVAADLGVSRRTLERMFALHVGHSPAAAITRSKLERARDLLITTRMPLVDVARQAGFFHVETLHRLFKQRFGLAPGGYRSSHAAESPSLAGGCVSDASEVRRRRPRPGERVVKYRRR